ncbi:YgaP family membrane protein [Alkalimarinus coralli]|uniref:YgaP family membrane protein n=1 Tax=Alkalimarinus coralli TaxID=2935863 RepID=UPI00202B51EA|nr:DUF2892 domain-containing protein [Alkalimarinus coralli]
MTINQALRLLAGSVVLISLMLGYYVAQEWLLLTLFTSLNLIQSAFTNWCPAMWFLRKLGVNDG